MKILRDGIRVKGNDNFWPSIHACEALTLAGHGDEVTKFLTPKLKTEKDDQHRVGLARELVRAGDRSKAAIMFDILAGKDPHGHVHACESLYKVNEIGDGTLMLAALNSKNIKQALMAAAALGRQGNAQAMKFLRDRLDHENQDIVRIVAWVLGRIGDARTDIPGLRAGLTQQKDPLIRAYFENSLALLGDPRGITGVLRNLRSDDPAIRTYSATFAGEARITSAKDRLIHLLDDDNIDARVRAAQALFVLSLPAPAASDEDISVDVFPATKENPRYSEGSILPLANGDLLYSTTEFVGSGSDHVEARIIARISSDGGRTWGDSQILQAPDKGKNIKSYCLFSDDQGKTWQKSKTIVDYSKRGAMEPELIEFKDGSIGMLIRTQSGHIAISYSKDRGETWSEAKSWGVRAPEAPATIRRVPSTGDLLLIWNDNYEKGAGHSGKRSPLTAAISTDEGKTWSHKFNLETSKQHTYSYISLTFMHGCAIMSYYVSDEKNKQISSRFRSLPIAAFYQ
ncbi:MAG: exo-alpha-sialidase [Verrucomicrobiales bacterium]|nr:exo-alpha-sialidase [Verrucomicrobiales bacterium]